MKRKIFLSGKITGDPFYSDKFKRVELFYAALGYIVLNPAMLPKGMEDADYMRICFAMVDSADEIVFLPDHKDSRGSFIEQKYCEYTDNKRTRLLVDDIARYPGVFEKAIEQQRSGSICFTITEK